MLQKTKLTEKLDLRRREKSILFTTKVCIKS